MLSCRWHRTLYGGRASKVVLYFKSSVGSIESIGWQRTRATMAEVCARVSRSHTFMHLKSWVVPALPRVNGAFTPLSPIPLTLSPFPSLSPYLTRRVHPAVRPRRGDVLVPSSPSPALQAGGGAMGVLIVEDRPDIHGIPDQYSEMPELVLVVQVRLLCCNSLLSTSSIKSVFLLVA